METTLQFEGKITGQFELERSLAYAPKIFAKYYARGLSRERGGFVGDTRKKNQFGVFQRPLLSRELWGGRVSKFGSLWSKQFARMFRGKIFGGNPLEGMTLQMGISQTSKQRPAILKLQSGGSISKGRMVIPVYANLKRYGIFPKIGSAGHWLRKLSDGELSKRMFSIKRGRFTLFYDKEMYAQNPRAALLFVSTGGVTIHSQFNFDRKWKEREPKAIERLRGDFDKAAQAINRGQFA